MVMAYTAFKIGTFEKDWSNKKINHTEEFIRNIKSTTCLVFLIYLSNCMAKGSTFPEYDPSKVFRHVSY